MGKCLQSQERIMILGTHSILAQPDVRVPLCQARHLWCHPVLQQLKQGGGGGGEEQQPVTACPSEPTSIYSSSSSSVCRSPSSAVCFPHLTLYSRHCPLPTVTWVFRFPYAISLSLSFFFFSFLTAASFALWTLTPENSPDIPGELRGYSHLGTAAVDGPCLGEAVCVWIIYWKCSW